MISLWLVQFLHLLVLSKMEFFAYPEFFIYPYLTSLGLKPYSQIIDQHFPGLFFLPLNFQSLGFKSPESFQILLLLIVLIQSVLIYKIAKKITSGTVSALMASLAYGIFQPVFAGAHMWLETFISLSAVAAYYFWQRRFWFWCGLALGIGLLFKQSVALPVLFLTFYLIIKKQFLPAVYFFTAGLLPLVTAAGYFFSRGILPDFLYWTVKFNFLYPISAFKYPNYSSLLVWTIPVVLLVFALSQSRLRRPLTSLLGWGLLFLPGGLSRFDLTKIQAVVPFICLIIGLYLGFLWYNKRFYSMVAAAFLIAFYLTLFYSRQTNWGQYRFFDTDTLTLSARLKDLVPPSGRIFLLGVQPHVHVLSFTRPVGDYFVYQLPWYLPLTQNKILLSLTLNPPRYVAYDTAASVDDRPITDYAKALVQYVNKNYRPLETIGSVVIYESRD